MLEEKNTNTCDTSINTNTCDTSVNKDDIIQTTVRKLEKEFGSGAIMKLNNTDIQDVPSISTGSLGLDLALGVGGIPKGRIIEIFGPESSGKTTIALQCIREAQKHNSIAAFIDAEYAFDKVYAEKLGVDLNRLLISQPNNGEEGLSIAEELIKSGAIDIIVIDSVAALVPKAELEGGIGDSRIGLQARLMSQALRKMTGLISKTNCTCIFINQLREKIGIMFGSPETTTGGNALKYYSTIRLDIRRITQIKDDNNDIIGNRIRVKVVKNKVAPPFRTAEFDIYYGSGVYQVGEIVDIAVENNIIQKSGTWFSYNGEKLGQGKDAVKEKLEKNMNIRDEILNLITNKSETKK